MPERSEATKVVRVSLDAPLETIHVEERYRQLLLIVMRQGSVVDQVWLPALSVMSKHALAEAIASHAGDRLWRLELRDRILLGCRGPDPGSVAQPSVTVVICTRDRADQLRSCLQSLTALRTRPTEVIVVDNAPTDDSAKQLCKKYPVRYVLEPQPGQSRARNRGIVEAETDLVAFTDDDCVVGEHWLDRLDRPFADPLVMAATGYVGPLELETRAQWLFEAHGGFPKHFERTVFGRSRSPANSGNLVGAGANMVFRRAAFEEIGLFAEDLGPGTPARAADETYQMYKLLSAGYRVEYDPARIVWHRHRRDDASLRATLYDYARSSTVCALRLLIKHREPAALRTFAWWLKHSVAEMWTSRGNPDWLPFGMAFAELSGALSAPWALVRSKLSRRRIPPITFGPATPPAQVRVVDAAAPPLSVVVPSRNRRAALGELLIALARQSYPADRFETVVVLDGSEDDSAEMIRRFDAPYALTVLEHDNAGAARSRNRGAEAAAFAHLVFVDDDIVPEPEFLAVHAHAHRRAPDDHIALGRCPPVVEGSSWWGQALRNWWEDHYRVKAQPGHRWTFADCDGGNVSLPRSLFLAAGGFDEDFQGQREDWELGVRLLALGARFGYHPDAVGRHNLDSRLETHLRHQRRHGRDDVLLTRKHPQVKAQLPLASFVDALPSANAALATYGPAIARSLETARLHRYWAKLVRRMITSQYVLGLTDALPSAEQFAAFVAPTEGEDVEVVTVGLDRAGPLSLPSSGSVELAVQIGPTARRVIASQPGEDWDWEVIADRILGRISNAARQQLILEHLDASERDDGRLSYRRGAIRAR